MAGQLYRSPQGPAAAVEATAVDLALPVLHVPDARYKYIVRLSVLFLITKAQSCILK